MINLMRKREAWLGALLWQYNCQSNRLRKLSKK
jgi:hypothetical protein